jgi:UDP-3-O-[3-hydroxymyristoyl] N-acetylglucosamine deacetylase
VARDSIVLEGFGLHTGRLCRLELSRSDGPTKLQVGDQATPLHALEVTRTDRGVAVRLSQSGPVVELVEHLFAAVGAHGAFRNLTLVVDGGEIPLLDGGATRFAHALQKLEIPRRHARARITRSAEFEVGDARYRFRPGDDIAVAVTTDFPAPIGRGTAAWDGSIENFARDIAPARTFGFAHERDALTLAGRARKVDLDSVMVFDDDGNVLSPGRPMEPAEVPRHKLLDLIGDLTLAGGPPLGWVDALRPGHSATHAALRSAKESGVLVSVSPAPSAPSGPRI